MQTPHALWTAMPTTGLFFDRFYEDRQLTEGWYSGGGALIHAGEAEENILLSPLPRAGGFYHLNLEQHGEVASCQVGDVTLRWEKGVWKLTDQQGEVEVFAQSPGTDWLCWVDEAFYFWADGRLLFRREWYNSFASGFFAIAAGAMVCRQFLMGHQGQLGVQFQDGGGELRTCIHRLLWPDFRGEIVSGKAKYRSHTD